MLIFITLNYIIIWQKNYSLFLTTKKELCAKIQKKNTNVKGKRKEMTLGKSFLVFRVLVLLFTDCRVFIWFSRTRWRRMYI